MVSLIITVYYWLMCNSNYTLLPLTIKTIVLCDDACHGKTKVKDDICCLNCVLWPIAFVLDVVLCPCLYCYYKSKKNTETHDFSNNDIIENVKSDEIKTEQPV